MAVLPSAIRLRLKSTLTKVPTQMFATAVLNPPSLAMLPASAIHVRHVHGVVLKDDASLVERRNKSEQGPLLLPLLGPTCENLFLLGRRGRSGNGIFR
jgi:hypothetical protein